jgi:hypothetical protein
MCHDRVDGPDIDLTHEFLGMMLAVRRAGVTDNLKQMQADGAISTRRGTISVLDRRRLEGIAGHGYGAPEAEYRRADWKLVLSATGWCSSSRRTSCFINHRAVCFPSDAQRGSDDKASTSAVLN